MRCDETLCQGRGPREYMLCDLKEVEGQFCQGQSTGQQLSSVNMRLWLFEDHISITTSSDEARRAQHCIEEVKACSWLMWITCILLRKVSIESRVGVPNLKACTDHQGRGELARLGQMNLEPIEPSCRACQQRRATVPLCHSYHFISKDGSISSPIVFYLTCTRVPYRQR